MTRVSLDSRLNGECEDCCPIKQALAGLSVGLVLTNGSGRVAWLNRAAARLLGLSEQECLGQHLGHVLKDVQLMAFWQESAEEPGNVLGDVQVQWPEPLALKVNATRYVDADGKEVGRALLFCDVTAERTVQVELSEAVAQRLLDLTSGHMPPEPVANLTTQEVRMLRLVGRGLGNEEIAEQANISASTVRSHLKSIYRKLGLNSRAEAVAFAARHHLV